MAAWYRLFFIMVGTLVSGGCATSPGGQLATVDIRFNDGSSGRCRFVDTDPPIAHAIPATAARVGSVGSSVTYDCRSVDGRLAQGSITVHSLDRSAENFQTLAREKSGERPVSERPNDRLTLVIALPPIRVSEVVKTSSGE